MHELAIARQLMDKDRVSHLLSVRPRWVQDGVWGDTEIAPPHLGRVPRGAWALGGEGEQGIAGLGPPIGRESGRQGPLANLGALRQEARTLA